MIYPSLQPCGRAKQTRKASVVEPHVTVAVETFTKMDNKNINAKVASMLSYLLLSI